MVHSLCRLNDQYTPILVLRHVPPPIGRVVQAVCQVPPSRHTCLLLWGHARACQSALSH
jgi:hypothetical protein